jgi:hypothetical protein
LRIAVVDGIAEHPRLIARRRHHAALGCIADRHRPPLQSGVVTLLHRRIESVHVHVDDLADGLVAHGDSDLADLEHR